MSLSSNSVIHFMSNLTSLEGILLEGFKVSFCKERISLPSDEYVEFYAAMICFCDIPLSQVQNHIESYGQYGIGMKKSWAENSGLNPVLYLEDKSELAKSVTNIIRRLLVGKTWNKWGAIEKEFADILRYTKNYEDDLVRKNMPVIRNYRFSDEREWRYVYPITKDFDVVISTDDYEKEKMTADSFVSSFRLDFEPDDIQYIIIKNEAEIHSTIELLRKVVGTKYSLKEVEKLTTRIITCEQIHGDIAN